MKEFVDETSVNEGTPINRANLMAIQGFIGKTTEFLDDGSILETNSNGETKLTTFDGGNIIETFAGEKIITKTTIFDLNGNIQEVLS